MKIPIGAYVTFRRELVNCGKPKCRRCAAHPAGVHGPYWYAYATVKGRFGKEYVGKNRAAWERARQPATATGAGDFAAMLRPTATPKLAARLLGVAPGVSRDRLGRAFRERIRCGHPDKGGTHEHAAALNAAFSMLRKLV